MYTYYTIRNLFHANAANQKVMAKLENIEFILMDIFSHQITPPLPSPLPTESTLPPVLLPPSTSQQSMSQLHVHIPSELPALVLLPPSTSQPVMYRYYRYQFLGSEIISDTSSDTDTAYFYTENKF